MRAYRIAGLLLALLASSSLYSYNRSLFFRTSSFWEEPRFVRPWLSTLDLQLSGGSSHESRNCNGRPTALPSLYEHENITALIAASPEFPLTLKGDPSAICFQAMADVFEVNLNLYQNFCYGFFLHFHLPAVVVRIFPSGFLEDSECCLPSRRKSSTEAEKPLELLTPFLKHHNLSVRRHDRPGLSDSTLFVGWSYSYEDTCDLDFIDMTFKTGVLFPTGKKRSLHCLFDIPYGYNGHWGLPLSGDLTFGAYDWLSLGFHAEAVFFRDKEQALRMKTDKEALTGLIVLGQGQAWVHQGPVWRVGTYLKADHFFNGLSLLLGLSYEQKNDDQVTPCDTETFSIVHVNKDPQFLTWSRSIFHFQAEYDFAHEDSRCGARIAIFYNHEITGHRVFNVSTTGGLLGLDVSWCL